MPVWTLKNEKVACRQINKENSSMCICLSYFHFYLFCYTDILTSPRNSFTEIVIEKTACLSYEDRLVDCSTLVTADSSCTKEAKVSNCELNAQG